MALPKFSPSCYWDVTWTALPTHHTCPLCLCRMWKTWVWSLGREDPLQKEMAIHSSTIAWKIPWTEEPGRLQSMGSKRVGHDWATSLSQYLFFCVWLISLSMFSRFIHFIVYIQIHCMYIQHFVLSALLINSRRVLLIPLDFSIYSYVIYKWRYFIS